MIVSNVSFLTRFYDCPNLRAVDHLNARYEL